MTQKTLQNMADFYLKKLFDNIPSIPVSFTTKMRPDVIGEFSLEEGEDYDSDMDELKNTWEYRSRYKMVYYNCGIELNRNRSYQDPLNHPIVSISINKRIQRNNRLVVATLLHELLHYHLWYTGYDYHDEDPDFHNRCLEMGFTNNYTDRKWDGEKWVDTYDYSKMDKYIRLYLENTVTEILKAS